MTPLQAGMSTTSVTTKARVAKPSGILSQRLSTPRCLQYSGPMNPYAMFELAPDGYMLPAGRSQALIHRRVSPLALRHQLADASTS